MLKSILLCLALISCANDGAFGGQLESQLSSEWKDKIVFFRQFPTPNKVHYDKNGAVIGHAKRGYWSSDGMVQIQTVSAKGSQLA